MYHFYQFTKFLYDHIAVVPQWIFCWVISIRKIFLREVALHLLYLIFSRYLLQPEGIRITDYEHVNTSHYELYDYEHVKTCEEMVSLCKTTYVYPSKALFTTCRQHTSSIHVHTYVCIHLSSIHMCTALRVTCVYSK